MSNITTLKPKVRKVEKVAKTTSSKPPSPPLPPFRGESGEGVKVAAENGGGEIFGDLSGPPIGRQQGEL